MQVIGALTQTAKTVGKMGSAVALTALQAFWFLPLAVLSTMFGQGFRNVVARAVSPRSIQKSESEND